MAFSSGFLSPPSLRCLSSTNLTVSILIPPDLYWSHPGSFARCLGQKQNEIWIWAGNNLRWSFLYREFQLFCSLGTANRLNALSVRALPPSLSLQPMGTVGSHTVWCEKRGTLGKWTSKSVPNILMYAHMYAHTGTQTQAGTQTRTYSSSSTLSTRGLCVQGWEMPCQQAAHRSLEGRKKLNSIKMSMWWKMHGGERGTVAPCT